MGKENTAIFQTAHGVRKLMQRIEDSFVDSTIKRVRSQFGIDIFVKNSGEIVAVTEWIKQHDPNFKYHIANPYGISTNKKKDKFVLMGIFIIKISEGTYLYVDAQTYRLGGEANDAGIAPIYMYLFGKHWMQEFENLSKFIAASDTTTNKMYSITGVKDNDRNYWNCTASKLTHRTMDTIFVDPAQKKRITDHIDQWINNEAMYTERGLLYKTGILLHGPAGTGKSSMAIALANYLECGLITIDPGTFEHMNIPEITESIVADEVRFVVLLDEVDAIFKSRDDVEKITDEQLKVTNKLLSFLDSAQSPTNVVFVATTNYPERLDKSLLRKGRFDLIEYMGDISVDVGREMCKSFSLSDEETEEIMRKLEVTDEVNPATLQDAILTSLKAKNQKTNGKDPSEAASVLVNAEKAITEEIPKKIEEEECIETEEDKQEADVNNLVSGSPLGNNGPAPVRTFLVSSDVNACKVDIPDEEVPL